MVDVDGTLVSAHGKDSWARIAHLYRSLDLGRPHVRLTIATGRTLAGVQPVLDLMGLSGLTPVVLYNGSLVCRSAPFYAVHHQTIGHHVARRLVSAAEAAGGSALVYCVAADMDEGHLGPPDELVYGFTKNAANVRPHLDFNEMPITWLDSPDLLPAVPATAVLLEGCEPGAIATIQEVTSTRGSGRWIEVRPVGSDKAMGVAEAARVLNIQRQAVLALGDGNNDAELLRWAGVGVSVLGATRLAEEASDYLSRQPVERAAIEVLYLVKEARRLLRQGESTAGGHRGHHR
ncbi:MAG: HAD family hydrolase [Candidatus Limnocylindrales bacterium]